MKISFFGITAIVIAIFFSGLFTGCVSSQWSPENMTFVPEGLLAADNAIEEARASGKDAECPDRFNAAERMKNKAWNYYWSCRTYKALKVARQAIGMVNKLCPVKTQPARAPAPPPVKKRPRRVFIPEESPPVLKVVEQMTLMINFDFNKAIIREGDKPALIKAVEFIRKYPEMDIIIEGHTCSIGPERYNQGLSERRAEAVKDFVVKADGINESRITPVGYSELLPYDSNATKVGRELNRRVEIIVLSEEYE